MGFSGFQAVSQDSQFQNAERSLKQALHQLNRLGNIWKDVLPSVVYNKSMGRWPLVVALVFRALCIVMEIMNRRIQ